MLIVEHLDHELQELKKQQAGLLEAKEKHYADNRLLYFVPHNQPGARASQVDFFNNATKKRRGVFCGNRWGKSTIGTIEDLSWAIGYRPFFPEGDPRRYAGIPDHGVKLLVVGEDWDKVSEIFTDNKGLGGDRVGKFWEWAPPWAIYDTHRNQQGKIDILYFRSELRGKQRLSSIYFDTVKSYMNNGAAFESSDWDALHIDEPMPRNMFDAITRGLIDRGGSVWALATMLRHPWLYRYVVNNTKDGHQQFWYCEGYMDDNPTLDEETKELYFIGMSEVEKDCRRKGRPMALGNLVVSGFSEDKFPDGHLRETAPVDWLDPYNPSNDWCVYYAIDPHPQTPHAVLFVAVSPYEVVIYDELWIHTSITHLAELIRKRLVGKRLAGSICDPFAWIPDPETGRSYADVLHSNGLIVRKGSKSRAAAILETNEWFLGKKDKKISVMKHCTRFLTEVAEWYYDKDDKPVDKDDHFMENIGRLVLFNDFRFLNIQRDPEPVLIGSDFEELNYEVGFKDMEDSYGSY